MGLLRLGILLIIWIHLSPAHSAWRQSLDFGVTTLLWEPLGARPPTGLFVVLHGCDQTPKDLADLSNWRQTAETFNIIVALPEVPQGGVLMGCWDYYGTQQSADNKHNKFLISWLEGYLKSRPDLAGKPVVFAGISSGATQAALIGCLRPDLVWGLGLVAGPALSTTVSEIGNPKLSSDQGLQFCRELAGEKSSFLSRLRVSLVQDPRDSIVHPHHTELMVEVFMKMHGVNKTSPIAVNQLEGHHPGGQGFGWFGSTRAKGSVLWIEGLLHRWPSDDVSPAPEQNSGYVNVQSLNYSRYLVEFVLH